VRTVPVAIRLQNSPAKQDSFSEGIVRATGDPEITRLDRADEASAPFSSYFELGSFRTVLASDILHGDKVAWGKVQHQIALVGAKWHRFAFHRGPLADVHPCPLGAVAGVYLHANYVEAILNHRTYKALPKGVSVAIEALAVLVMASCFAVPASPLRKVIIAGGACLGLLVLAYFTFQNLGLFFDFFIPLVLVASHAGLDEVRDWKEKAIKWDLAHPGS